VSASRVSIGPTVIGFNTAIQAIAGSYAIGDVIVCVYAEHLGSDHISVPSGWTDVGDPTNADQTRAFGIIADSNSVALPSIQFGSDRAFCYAMAYRGITLTAAFAAAGRQTNTLQNISGPSSSKTASGPAVVWFVGNRNKTTVTNGNSYSAPSFTGSGFSVIQQHAPTGNVTSGVCCEWIQNTPFTIPANITANGAIAETTAQAQEGLLFGLLIAAIPGPTYTSDPTLSTLAATSASFNQTLDQDCTAYAVAVAHGAGAPSAAQIKAGQNASGTAAVAATNGSATATAPKSLTLTGLTAATAYDFYFVGNDANGDTAVKSVLNQTTPVLSTITASIASHTTDGHVVNFTPGATGTVYLVACIKGSATPASALVRTGTPSGFIARFSKAATNAVADSIAATALTLPKADLHIILNASGVDSPVTSFLDQLKLPAAGRQYSSFGTLAASSPFQTLTPAIAGGDVLDIVSQTPSAYAVLVTSGGDVEVDAFGDESRELLAFNIYDDSAGAMYYTADSTLVINDKPPSVNAPSGTVRYSLPKNSAVNIPLTNIFTDPEDDEVTVTELSSLLTTLGLSIVNNAIVGTTPNAFSTTDHISLNGADKYLGSAQTEISLVIGEQQIPNSAGLAVAVYSDLVRSSGFTPGDITWQLSAVAKGQVISTSPSYPDTATPDTEIDIVGSGAHAPDLRGFTYVDAVLIAQDQGFTVIGGPFSGFVLDQSPQPDTLMDPSGAIFVTNSASRYYGVEVGEMQPSGVTTTSTDFAHAVQVVVDLAVGMKRIELLHALEAITNYIRSRKFP